MKIQDFNLDEKVFIIAEISANHNQNLSLAKETILAAKETGADAVKFQTYTPDTITLNSKKKDFLIKSDSLWDGEYLYDLYKRAYTPWEWHAELFDYANSLGLMAFSSPFDKSAVDLLEKLNTPAYKIASFEITDIPLIEYVASKQKPVIISTGIATLCDIQDAVYACQRVGNSKIILLKCTSAYPAPLEEVNLKTIPNLKEIFHTEVGLSDHTLGVSVSIASVALGARVIEKHFMLDKSIKTPDSDFSLDKQEFSLLVKSIREVEKALGGISYEITPKIQKSKEGARSLYVTKDIKKGEVFTEENIRSVRPGYGLHPKYFYKILGKKAVRDLEYATALKWEDII